MYQWNPAEYARNSSFQKSAAYDYIQKIPINETDKILDIGCGDGKITLDLAKNVPQGFAIGLDFSPDMVRYARTHFQSVKSISFIHGNAQSLPFFNEFDIIFSNYCFHWIPNHYQLLAGVYCALRPGGKLYVQMSVKRGTAIIYDALDEVIVSPKWKNYFIDFIQPFEYHTLDEYQSILENAEFKIQKLETIPRNIMQKDREGLTGMLRAAFLPALERVPSQLKEDFLREMVDIILDRYPASNDGEISLPSTGLQFEAHSKG